MKNLVILYFILFTLNLYSQNRTITFIDEQKKPVTNFQLNFFIKDSLTIYKSTNSNNYNFKQSLIKEIDSVFITFDSFYSKKINITDLILKDSIFLKKEIPLDEVIINKKFIRKELGVISKNRNIFKIGNASRTDKIIEIDVSNHFGVSIESINLYIFEKFRDLYNKKHTNKNLDIKFYLFQSNTNPNENVINLLEKELVVNTERGNKGWVSIDLKKLNIKIKDFKYLYIGYSVFGKPIAAGAVKRKRIKSDKNITSYIRSSSKDVNRKWIKSHFKIYLPEKELSEPAIKIEIKY
ncbi:hypothetical protein VDP25_11895 [Winogradskyella sp. ECml5-4]|uniref:hypothetical protein n=1 Tax=Winogradskyella sp. ECml5-4 TaxID=3110975 RepID=UPI002FF3B27D